ncbi:MAG TPA: 16S rRNA (cytidine(1402)-2'-O)-methyltransferase [Oscillospiraceae bacterium]|nr:16S rRNA (cytidine(1402)-2'-O)-methyltransferase [Oscillospiraceae bacterium]
MNAILYIVGTPIGNLGDISPRALKTLGECDFIAAEDTRVTLKLLNHFGINKPLVSYHEHNFREKNPVIIERLLSGESCALVCDAGMPVISDPGEQLISLCHKKGIDVKAVPGPSALITALSVSGFEARRFTFEGFLTTAKTKRKKHLQELIDEKRTMIFYEAPHKLSRTLEDMLNSFGDRNISIVKELTKIYENIEITTLSQAIEKYKTQNPKGEYVLILEGAKERQTEIPSLESAAKIAKTFYEQGLSTSDAAKKAAEETGRKKSEIYKLLIDYI